MNNEQLAHEAETLFCSSELVIRLDGGSEESHWLRDGKVVAGALGVPSRCSNKPQAIKSKRCVHLWFKDKFLSREVQTYIDFDTMRLYDVAEEIEKWINQQTVLAIRAEFVGNWFITRGVWHSLRERWMIGPKERLPGC